MPHLIDKVTGECLYNASISLLADPEWKKPGWPGDPNYHVGIPNLNDLFIGGTPAQYVKAVDVGGGIFEAEEMDQAEKDAVDLPILKESKLLEINQAFQSSFDGGLPASLERHWPQSAAHLPALKTQYDDAVAAATTVAEVAAITVDFSPVAVPAANDKIHVFLNEDTPAIAVGDGWVKVGGATVERTKGATFSNDGLDNHVLVGEDCAIDISMGATFELLGASGRVEVAISRNGVVPPANFQRAGFSYSGVVGQRMSSASHGFLDVLENDTYEVWARVLGAGASAVGKHLWMVVERDD